MKLLPLAVLTIACSLALRAGDAIPPEELQARKQAAEKLLVQLKMERTFDDMMKQVMDMQAAMVERQQLTDAEKKTSRIAVEEAMATVREKFSYSRMKDLMVDVYAEVFTVEEIDGLTAFYQSPVGQKFVDKQPELSRAMMTRMGTIMAEVSDEMQTRIRERLNAPDPKPDLPPEEQPAK